MVSGSGSLHGCPACSAPRPRRSAPVCMVVRVRRLPSTIGRRTSRNSSKRAMRSAGGHGSCPSALASGPSLPGPRPRSSRPSLRSSSARASRASVTGWRKLGVATSVPSRMRSVTAGRGGQHGYGGVPGPVGHAAPADVVVGPRRGEAGVVGPLPLPARLAPAVGRKDDQADSHGDERSGPDTLPPWPTSRRASDGTTRAGPRPGRPGRR